MRQKLDRYYRKAAHHAEQWAMRYLAGRGYNTHAGRCEDWVELENRIRGWFDA